MITQGELDALWDFDDPIGSEQRLRTAAASASTPDRAEYLTQVARALGLQDRFTEAAALLDELDTSDVAAPVAVRIALERGRIENSSGQPSRAVPHFMIAVELASDAGLDFLRIDALHMLAITDPGRSAHWTVDALALASSSPDLRTRRWAVSLHNNYGWTLFDNGDVGGAITEFEQAVSWAEQVGTPVQQQYAREALTQARQAQDTDAGS